MTGTPWSSVLNRILLNALLLSAVMSCRAPVAKPTAQAEPPGADPVQVVDQYMAAWNAHDAARAAGYMTDDVVYYDATVGVPQVSRDSATGPFADGTKPTGKKFSLKGASLIRLRGDHIAYQGDYYDSYGVLKQLGLAN